MPAHPSGLLILTPHSSGALPAEVLSEMLGEAAYDSAQREARQRAVFLDGDPYTDLLFRVPGAQHLNAPWSRFVVDLNRERDEDTENGVIKLTGFDRRPLYPPGFALSPAAREARLRRYWDSFDTQVRAELAQGSVRALLVGHSMAEVGPALSDRPGESRPAFTLMVGEGRRASFPPQLVPALQQAAARAFAALLVGHARPEVAVNDPWNSDNLSVRYQRATGLPAFGLEVNAGLYLRGGQPQDAAIRAIQAGMAQLGAAVLALLDELGETAQPG